MRSNLNHSRLRLVERPNDIAKLLSHKLIGQPAAIAAIVPFVQMYRAMLSPEGRPAGVFLLLGPTGTGKTKTVEALAEVLHGSARKVLKIDCGEFQMEHEVAKLIGAPPGYLGHRETQPFLTQQKVNNATSESSDLSILLFDEIEKGAASMLRLLLGVLDKGALRLGDGTTVNFEKTLIFFTSNLGAHEMNRELRPGLGFAVPRGANETNTKLESIGMHALRKTFSPEFINRIDAVVAYKPLDADAMTTILDQHVEELQQHLHRRLGHGSFQLEVPARSRKFLLHTGASDEFGARELKRTLQKQVIHPLASMLAAGEIAPGARIRAELSPRKDRLVLRDTQTDALAPAC